MSIFLGLDSSTQGLKAEIIDVTSGKIICSKGVNFGKDLPDYNCHDGFLLNDDPANQTCRPAGLAGRDGLAVFKTSDSRSAAGGNRRDISGSRAATRFRLSE